LAGDNGNQCCDDKNLRIDQWVVLLNLEGFFQESRIYLHVVLDVVRQLNATDDSPLLLCFFLYCFSGWLRLLPFICYQACAPTWLNENETNQKEISVSVVSLRFEIQNC
jgi:hypothetical protein